MASNNSEWQCSADWTTGLDIRLHRNVVLYIDHYRIYGRNGIYVSFMRLRVEQWPETNV